MTPVTLEVGKKKVFASAVDWPGWCRAGRTEDDALHALASYADRYRIVADRSGLRFPESAPTFDVIERLGGDATTDFGAPGAIAAVDREPVTAPRARRLVALLEAAWTLFDEVVAASSPALRKGPRGGGRDRDAVFEHVIEAERSYARQCGVRHRAFDPTDQRALAAMRADLTGVLRRSWPSDESASWKWPLRYAVRRIAWHVLDHAWEIEDKQP